MSDPMTPTEQDNELRAEVKQEELRDEVMSIIYDRHKFPNTVVDASSRSLRRRDHLKQAKEIVALIDSEVTKVLERLESLPNVYPEKIEGVYTHVEAIYKSAVREIKEEYDRRTN